MAYGFPYKGNLLKPNLVPYDKFKPENQVRAYEYLKALFNLHPEKIKFVDEKHLRGEELFAQKVRRDPCSGLVPIVLVDPDFRNTHNITAFCSINRQNVAPVWYRIHDGSNTQEEFHNTCEKALQDGYFQPYDVLVADNATIHNDIEEMLWQCCRVLVIKLPTRTPEWNPKEKVWRCLVIKLGTTPVTALQEIRQNFRGGKSIVAKAAAHILNGITFDEVRKYYSECYDFFPHWRVLIEDICN